MAGLAVVCEVEGGICASIAGDVVEAGSSWAGEAIAVQGVAGLAARAGLAGSGSSNGEGIGGAGVAGSIAIKSISGVAGETNSGGTIAGEAVPSAGCAEIDAST